MKAAANLSEVASTSQRERTVAFLGLTETTAIHKGWVEMHLARLDLMIFPEECFGYSVRRQRKV